MGSDTELMFPALYVDCSDEEFDMNLPPSTGNEYLRRVRLEAAQCPDIVVANIDASRFTVKQTLTVEGTKGCQPAPKGYAPSLSWQRRQVAEFSKIRISLAQYKSQRSKMKDKKKRTIKFPQIDDDVEWCKLCFGNKFQREVVKHTESNADSESTAESTKKEENSDGMLPLVSVVSAMSQPLIEQVLDYHLSWFEATGFTREQGCWFYALLACLEKPLTPDACSSLRSLVRLCANLRATLRDDDPGLTHLNLLICLVTRYFDQSDLADDEN